MTQPPRVLRFAFLNQACIAGDEELETAMRALCPPPYSARELGDLVPRLIEHGRPADLRQWWAQGDGLAVPDPKWWQLVFKLMESSCSSVAMTGVLDQMEAWGLGPPHQDIHEHFSRRYSHQEDNWRRPSLLHVLVEEVNLDVRNAMMPWLAQRNCLRPPPTIDVDPDESLVYDVRDRLYADLRVALTPAASVDWIDIVQQPWMQALGKMGLRWNHDTMANLNEDLAEALTFAQDQWDLDALLPRPTKSAVARVRL